MYRELNVSSAAQHKQPNIRYVRAPILLAISHFFIPIAPFKHVGGVGKFGQERNQLPPTNLRHLVHRTSFYCPTIF